MKNATKLVWLLVFASSIMFAFGQTGANQMTFEQKVAHDNSVVVKSGEGIDLSVAPSNHNTKAILLNETFDAGLPASWFQVQYSGAGIWQHVPTQSNGVSSYTPPNTDGNFACCDSDGNSSWVYDVGFFTHSLDMSAAAGPERFAAADPRDSPLPAARRVASGRAR